MTTKNNNFPLISRIFSAFFAVYMFGVQALPLATIQPVKAAVGFPNPIKYVRENNSGDISVQVYTPVSATDIRFQVNGVDVTFSELVTDVDPISNDAYDNDIYQSSAAPAGEVQWRLNKALPAGEYSISAEYSDGASWIPVVGTQAVYSLDTPWYTYKRPSALFYKPTANFARVKIDDEYYQQKEFRFKIFDTSTDVQVGGEYVLSRDDCDTLDAGNSITCDLMRDYTGVLPTLVEGDYYLRTQSYTHVNNGIRYPDTQSNVFTIDNTKPTISNLVLEPVASAYKDSITVSASASDNNLVKQVKFYITEPNVVTGLCDGKGDKLVTEIATAQDADTKWRASLDISAYTGDYCVTAVAKDFAGWNSTKLKLDFVADNTPPVIPTLIAPEDNFMTTNSVSFTQEWESSADAVQYKYESCYTDPGDLNGACSSVKYTTTTSNAYKIVTPGQPDSHFWWRVKASDNLGNWSDWSESREVTIDSHSPTSTLSLLSTPDINSGITHGVDYIPPFFNKYDTVVFEGVATDSFSAIKSVMCYYTTDNWVTSNSVAASPKDIFDTKVEEFTCTLPSSVTEGTYQIESRAEDITGLLEETPYSNDVVFSFDTVNPMANFVGYVPSDNQHISGAFTFSVNFDGTHPDDSRLHEIKLSIKKLDGPKWYSCYSQYNNVSNGTYDCLVDPLSDTRLTDGNYELRAVARDKSGLWKNNYIPVILDNTAPELSLPVVAPVEATSVDGSVVNFTVTATDNIDGSVTPVCSHNSGDVFPVGTTTVTCSATDMAGNFATGTFDVVVEDTTAPEVDITYPADGDLVGGTVSVKGSVTDLFPHHYYLMAKDSSGVKLDSNYPGLTLPFPGTINRSDSFTNIELHSWDTTEVVDGDYTIWLAARDAYDNRDDSVSYDSITVTVDNTAPVVEDVADNSLNEGDLFPSVTLNVSDNESLKKVCLRVVDPDGTQVYPSVAEVTVNVIDDGCDYSVLGESNHTYDVNDWFGLPTTFWTLPTNQTPVLKEGDWTFEYWAFDEVGNESEHQTTTYTLNNLAPTVSITKNTFVSRAIQMVAEGLNGNSPYTYSWSGGNFSACSGTENYVVTPTDAGIYTCMVTVTDFDGETYSHLVTAEVEPEPVTYFTFVPQLEPVTEEEDDEVVEEETAEDGEVLGERTCDEPKELSTQFFIDENGDGEYQKDEELISGIKVALSYILDGVTVNVGSFTSDSNGMSTAQVCPGEYTITVDLDSLSDSYVLDKPEFTVDVLEDNQKTNISISLKMAEEDQKNYTWLYILLGLLLVIIVGYTVYRMKKD